VDRFVHCLSWALPKYSFSDAQEIQLIQKAWAPPNIHPYGRGFIEALFQSVLTGAFCIFILFSGKGYLADLYNHFLDNRL